MSFDAFKGSEGFIGRWDCFDHTLLEINQIYINEKEIWREKEITQDFETRYIYNLSTTKNIQTPISTLH